jgi:hypothetical protein
MDSMINDDQIVSAFGRRWGHPASGCTWLSLWLVLWPTVHSAANTILQVQSRISYEEQ